MKLAAPVTLLVLTCLSLLYAQEFTPAKNQQSPEKWKSRLAEVLPAFGHRNYIVIADSAYPKQSNPAIETIATTASQIEILEHVLAAIKKQPHVYGVAMVDAELAHVTEEAAPGIVKYRTELSKLLEGQTTETLPHDEIIKKLDESAKLFNVLLIKSDMVLPYTSVFIRLECGYWDPAREKALREAIKKQ